MGPNTALSMDSDCEPLKNAKDMSSTFVKLSFAIAPAIRVVLCAKRYAGFGRTRLTNSCASRNLKMNLESASLFMKGTPVLPLSILTAPERREIDVSGRYICHYVIVPTVRPLCSDLFYSIAR